MRRLLFLFLLITPISGLCSETSQENGSTKNPSIELQEPDDDQLRLLNVFLDNLELDEIINAYQIKENLMLPLGSLSEILSLAINTRPEEGNAEGFILKENRRFYLDASRREVTLLGKTSTYAENMVVIYADDIYVEAQQLTKWFPFLLDVDLFALTILVKPSEPFPLQKKLERERRIEEFRSKTIARRDYPRQITDYQLLSTPFIDQTIALNAINNKNAKDTLSSRYTTYASLDLLYMESSLYLSGNNEESLDTYRITMGRNDPEASLLGPLNATEFSFGNISAPGVNLISSSHSSDNGLTISNHPLSNQRDFDTHTFEGNLLPGWEVELYHNNQLINFQTEPVDGQYRFEDVTLLFGYNFFRLVFYGPNGQEREETHKFQLDRALTRPGERNYRLNMVEDRKTHDLLSSLQYDIGLNKTTSAKFGLVTLPLDDERHNYTSAGIISFWKSFLFDFEYAQDSKGGNTREIDLQTKISKSNLKYNHTEYNDFISQTHSSTNTLTSSSDIRLDTAIPSGWLPSIPVKLEYDKRHRSTGSTNTVFSNRLSTSIRGFSISNNYRVARSSSQAAQHSGEFQISRRRAGKSLRNRISYRRKPDSEINSIAFNYGGNRLGPFRLGLGYTHFANNNNQYTVDLDKRKGDYSLNIKSSYNTNGTFSLNLRASMSFGRNPANKQWVHDSNPMANRGSSVISTFMDDNQNGIRDEKEQGLQDVAFKINGARKTSPTDEDGHAFLTRLTPYQSMDFSVAIETLEDPLWLPAVQGIQIIPRPGQVAQISFPILLTGEIDGTVYLQTEDGKQPAGNVELQLLDKDGKVVESERSAFDGFYIIGGFPMGTYELRISPEQTQRLGLMTPESKTIILSAEEPFLSGIDYVLIHEKSDSSPPEN